MNDHESPHQDTSDLPHIKDWINSSIIFALFSCSEMHTQFQRAIRLGISERNSRWKMALSDKICNQKEYRV